MKPRDYQLACLDAIRRELDGNDSTLAELATGLGKTVIFSHLARDWPSGRVLVVAHRDELIRQAAGKIEAVTGKLPAVEMGASRADEDPLVGLSRVVVTSVQTMSRPRRMARFKPDDFGLVIIDEAHHAVGGSYGKVLAHFTQNPACKVLGVTATPRRHDGLATGQVFETLAFQYGIEAGIADGWLVPIRQAAVKVEGLDFSKVRRLAGDLGEAELERVMTEERVLHATAAPTVELAGDRPALVFCVNVNHAKLMAEVLNRYKPGSARFLSGKSDPEERRRTVEAYRYGGLQFLCNCGLFLEGFDAPITGLVVMARPTLSLPLYTQVLGRVTRVYGADVDALPTAAARLAAIAASAKPAGTVLDFVGNSGRHRIMQAADVLGGRWAQPVRDYARRLAEEEPGTPAGVAELLDRADAELAFLAEEEELARRRHVKAQAAYATRAVSPFGGQAASAPSSGDRPPEEAATPKQRGLLYHLGVSWEASAKFSKRQASAVINKLRAEGQLAS